MRATLPRADGPTGDAYRVLAELDFPLPLNVDDLRTYLGLDLVRDARLPARVRGVLDVEEHLIVVREGLPPSAESHVVCHEGGHYQMATHRALLYRCSEFDLSEQVRRRMEVEANAFAATLRFGAVPHGWVDDEEPSVARVRALTEITGASLESALRWYVENSRRAVWGLVCGLAVAQSRGGAGGRDQPAAAQVRYGCRSTAAVPLEWPAVIPVPLGLGRATCQGPPEWRGYWQAGARHVEVHATAYWTCALLW